MSPNFLNTPIRVMREDVGHGVAYGGRGLEASSATIKIGEMHTSEDSDQMDHRNPQQQG